MVATIPPLLVPKPTPSMPLRYGLLQAAVGPLDLPIHGRNGGVRYVTPLCGEGFGYEIECIGAQNSKAGDFGDSLNTVTGVPFIIYATMQCGTVGFNYNEFQALIVERLKGVEQAMLEEIFSTATFAAAPALTTAAGGIAVLAGTGVTAVEVVSELERAMYCGGTLNTAYGPPAYLHMPIPVLNELKSQHLIEFDGTRWRTPLGTVVSAGCYAGNSPVGVAPADGSFWIYITGQTAIWRTPDSAIQVAPVEGSLNRTTNQMMMLAEREYVVTFECAGYAKQVTLWP